jgi:hypothetical protein
MAELQRFPLVTSNGQTGHVFRRARFIDTSEQSRVVLEDGTELIAPANSLEPQADGSFLLRVPENGASGHNGPAESLPVQQEARTEPASRNPQGSTEALFADEVGIERVAVNQIVDQPPANRQEGDILVIPVVEEILVVQKRYMIKEEIRINRSRRPVAEPRRILLDTQEVRS